MIPNTDLVRYISLALQANKNFIKDKDYVIHPNVEGQPEIVLLDQATGRLMEMTRLQGGLHQAIEAKEGPADPVENTGHGLLLTKTL